MEIIFIAYKLETKTRYIGKTLRHKDISIVEGISNIKFNTPYYLVGELNNDNIFEAKEFYEYSNFIGEITNVKALKNKKSLATIKTENSKIIKAEVNDFSIEVNSPHIFKGYQKGQYFITTFVKKLETKKVRIKENTSELCEKYNSKLLAEIYEEGLSSKEKIFLIGCFSLLYKEDIIDVYGYKDGNYFITLSYYKDINSDLEMMKLFLKNVLNITIKVKEDDKEKTCKLGKVIKDKIIAKYGIDTISKLENQEEFKKDFPNLREEFYDIIYKRIIAAKYTQDFFYFCQKKNISIEVANYIFKQYGAASLDRLKENPYIITEAKPNLFVESDIFANELKWEANNISRIEAAIRCLLFSDMETNGNMFMYMDDLLNELNPYLLRNGTYTDYFIEKEIVLEAIQNLKDLQTIEILENKVYLKFNYIYEKETARLLRNLIDDYKKPFCMKNEIDIQIDNFNKKNNKLDKKQELAIKQALLSNISILTGGPGTGKTLTVKAILDIITSIRPGAKVKLCAPTGRASKRMTEVSNYSASTIHKLLNLNQFDTLTKDSDIPKEMQELDFLIVDEFSMVDAKLFYELLICLDERTRLIIVGDYNQLPSVGPGQILKDLIDSCMINTIELTEIFRQAGESNIIKIAHNIINNKNINIREFKIDNIKDILNKDVCFIESSSIQKNMENIFNTIDTLFEKGYTFNNVQLLSPMNKGELGTNYSNEEIQRVYNHKENEKDKYYVNSMLTIHKNDKVIQTVNNYDPTIMVMNGSIGYVKNIVTMEDDISHKLKDDEITIEFDEEDKIFEPKYLQDIKLAYNITIHKSQGSEFPIVIMPIDFSQRIMLNKNLVYTGITRAKEKLIIIGQSEAFYYALNTLFKERNSSLKEFLINKKS